MKRFKMVSAVFDTLLYAKKLQKAGFTSEQAEIQAETLKEMLEDNLATKYDLKEAENVLHLKIAELKNDLVKWVLGISVAQAAIIISCIKLIR